MEFALVGSLRLVAALPILKWSLPFFYLAGQLDKWDWEWLDTPPSSGTSFYQLWDKSIDTFCLSLAAVTVLAWKDPISRRLALTAFGLRVIGFVGFLITADLTFFLVFPNVFERVFLFYLVFALLFRGENLFYSWSQVPLVFLALLLPKLFEEYYIQEVGARPWDLYTVLPQNLSTDRTEYWFWNLLLLLPPALAMAWLGWNRRHALPSLAQVSTPLQALRRRA